MFDYKPKSAVSDHRFASDLGSVPSDFEAFQPNPKYNWQDRTTPSKDAWKIVVPKSAPTVGRLPQIIEKMITSTWKFAEPSAGAQRGNIVMGTRGGPAPPPTRGGYHPQVLPHKQNIPVDMPNSSAIASDWKLFNQIERTNAVTFRGDTRPPGELLVQYGGFTPPNSRTDAYYLENNIFDAFARYLNERYKRTLNKNDFLRAVNAAAPGSDDQKLLVDYMMWRKISEGESMHLGRMVANECLKGYISTSRAVDTAIQFGTRHNVQPGWVYITVVHAGFIVPFGALNSGVMWGSGEAEIAQWGPIPSERIVGFAHVNRVVFPNGKARWAPDSPIWIRRTFRKSEPKAFETVFNIMSGKVF